MKTTTCVLLALALALGGCREAKPADLEIVTAKVTTEKDFGTDAFLRGSVHNPRETPARGVVVTVELWLLDLLAEKSGAKPKRLRPMRARLEYLPAGATVEFNSRAWLGELPKYASVRKGTVTVAENVPE